MKKIDEGKFEVTATYDDAVDRFLQLQGRCRSEINRECEIYFICTNKGKIAIRSPMGKRYGAYSKCSTKLRGEITMQDGKTYVNYYTTFNRAHNIFMFIAWAFYFASVIAFIVLNIVVNGSIGSPVPLVIVLALGIYVLCVIVREKRYSPSDSLILIKELEKRVEAVNLWDK